MSLGWVLGALFGRGSREPQPVRVPVPAPDPDPVVTAPPLEGPVTRPSTPMQPFEVLTRDADAVGCADTGDFVAWCSSVVDREHSLPWTRVWGLYHEYCTLHGCRPRTARKLQQELPRHGVEKYRPAKGRQRPTVYTMPAMACVEKRRRAA